MIVAVAGNPNCGKTTVFNLLTGGNGKVGNFPGVTVESREGELVLGKQKVRLIDIPGVYSLTPFSEDEKTAGNLLLSKPDAILNIIDATNLQRSLFFTFQILSLGIPTVIAVNMTDELKKRGGKIDFVHLSALLGVPVCSVCGADGSGIPALKKTLNRVLLNRFQASVSVGKRAVNADFTLKNPSGSSFSFSGVENLKKSREEAVSDQYRKIEEICREVVLGSTGENRLTEAVDRIAFGKITAFPVFFLILALMFFLTFTFPGGYLRDGVGRLFGLLSEKTFSFLLASGAAHWICGLVCDGILQSVGSVLSFLPTVMILFFCIGILEDSGYLARIAVLFDRPFSYIGLSGRSAVPLLMGFGCSVPAVMACRTVSGRSGRIKSILLTPFASCSAKIPIYTVFTGLFFKQYGWAVILFLYLLGVLVGFLGLLLLNQVGIGRGSEFLIELPSYRIPSLRNGMISVRDKCVDFLRKVFTVIFLAGIGVWLFENLRIFGESPLHLAGSFLSPLFSPIGFGNDESVAALLSGLAAKEAVVSAFSSLLGDLSLLKNLFTPASALSFMTFTLFYPPCFSALAAVKKEAGGFICVVVFVMQILIAWLVSFFVYRLCGCFL